MLLTETTTVGGNELGVHAIVRALAASAEASTFAIERHAATVSLAGVVLLLAPFTNLASSEPPVKEAGRNDANKDHSAKAHEAGSVAHVFTGNWSNNGAGYRRSHSHSRGIRRFHSGRGSISLRLGGFLGLAISLRLCALRLCALSLCALSLCALGLGALGLGAITVLSGDCEDKSK
jgi:hypothetical protein